MALFIVCGYHTVQEFKKSRYFRVNLGLVQTIDKGGRRLFNDKDKFSHFYNNQYRATIYGQGNIGDIKFYTDHFIKDNTIAVYYNETFEEFLFDLNYELIKEKGIDFYIGHILKNVEEQYEERVKKEELRKLEPQNAGNPEMITMNPGAVSYADLKAYLDKRNKERYKNNL
jgi:hypothetical protein